MTVVDTAVIDCEVARQLERLRKGRLFGVFDTILETRKLVESLQSGGLALASRSAKAEALAWCARFLSMPVPDEAQSVLEAIASPVNELTAIARGLITAGRGHLNEALGELTNVGTPIGRGAAYISVLKVKGFDKAYQWLQEAELAPANLDSDAKFFYLKEALENGEWTRAFEAATALSDADFERSPALILAAADAYLMQAVPDELRMLLIQHVPFDVANFPLRSEPESLAHRQAAANLYKRMHSVAENLGLHAIAGHAADRSLWLRLTNPETATEAQSELVESLKDRTTLLRRLNFALQFGITVDLVQVEKEVDRLTALSGGASRDAAIARFALAVMQKSHADAADYVERHREQLLEHIGWKSVYFFEIEMLVKSDQTAQAQVRLQESIDRGLTDAEARRLRRQLAEATGSDPIAERLATYGKSRSITDLRLLIDAYEEAKNWEKIVAYRKLLLDQTGDITDARRYAIALYNQEHLSDVLAVFAEYPALTDYDDGIHLLHAQTLFEQGNIEEARSVLDSLRQKSDSADARQLLINLTIASGDWESLQGFIESEWSARNERTAVELVRAGEIAQHIGTARGKDLVREAAWQASDDPAILLSCYQAASTASWEHNPEVHQWFERAATLSEQGSDGPVQKLCLEELVNLKPDWEKHETDTWNLLVKGEIPIFTAGQLLNQSLISLFLLPALSNLSEMDVRKRPLVYGFSGGRGKHTVDPRVIAMDPTSLMTAEFLGLLDVYIEIFDRIIIPHNTLAWLFEEKARILFHQPSRVAAAQDLRRMIDERHLQVFEGSTIPPESLILEVGEELAALVAEASSKDHLDSRQRLVVRGRPVHKVSTFMKEEADLGAYESYFCSSLEVVDKLVQKGILTTSEAELARAALQIRERSWPSNHEITDGAILYLDDVTISHLEPLGLLPKLHRADITAVVSHRTIEQTDALITYDAKGADVVNIVERMRMHVKKGLENGKVKLGRVIRGGIEDGPQNMMAHPTVAMLKLVDQADASVVDDRFVNQHASISSEAASRPLLTTLDILDVLQRRNVLSTERKQEARTTLRRANFAMIPLDSAELSRLISYASIANGVLTETAELRAVRESILRLQMSEVLQSPKELSWLNNILGACLLTLRNQWKDGLDESVTVARSDWLLTLSDVRGWTHRLNEDAHHLMKRYRNWVALLMMAPVAEPEPVKAAYWRWLDSRVLGPIEEEDPETYSFLIGHAKLQVSQGIESLVKDLEYSDD
ncbi:hypothetical protein [Microbulbifer halophilus]|uniref:HTH domain-containing protein n=1 Tax=Microbulbifer halophilus TaxID=453963 RepID=A0ABW5EBP7_9GAMM|nr:hypothetical protein [Microbulbifer halophilus]MCW8126048.1 hypothetical protein [Microbulbifer halophilus]